MSLDGYHDTATGYPLFGLERALWRADASDAEIARTDKEMAERYAVTSPRQLNRDEHFTLESRHGAASRRRLLKVTDGAPRVNYFKPWS
jgi:hypothetical protein